MRRFMLGILIVSMFLISCGSSVTSPFLENDNWVQPDGETYSVYIGNFRGYSSFDNNCYFVRDIAPVDTLEYKLNKTPDFENIRWGE
ncbi:MAG: hypothetical protein JXR56_04820 [Candidatus Cloacimonetes bacterium]|nr:hypothetical protein [Candidatus Cloacimonadota bacterium]